MNTLIKTAVWGLMGAWMMTFCLSCAKQAEDTGTIINVDLGYPPGDTGRVFKSDGLRLSLHSSFQFVFEPSKGDYFFSAQNADLSLRISYNYCDNTRCNPYGIYLSNETQSRDTIESGTDLIILDKKVYFYKSGLLKGILFYRRGAFCVGKFYWTQNGSYAEALEVEYDSTKFEELLSILSTIR